MKLAKQAVNCAPSEFVTWAKLTEVYIDMGMYESVSALEQSMICWPPFAEWLNLDCQSGTLDTELVSDVYV